VFELFIHARRHLKMDARREIKKILPPKPKIKTPACFELARTQGDDQREEGREQQEEGRRRAEGGRRACALAHGLVDADALGGEETRRRERVGHPVQEFGRLLVALVPARHEHAPQEAEFGAETASKFTI
jgi:hypothetical protein